MTHQTEKMREVSLGSVKERKRKIHGLTSIMVLRWGGRGGFAVLHP